MARILFVEDEAALRTALASFLRMQGLDVDAAAGFQEAAAQVDDGVFDLLVTDDHLGDGRGSDLARRFLEGGEGRVLLVTATPDDVDEGISEHDRVEVWKKPARPAQIFAWLQEHMPSPAEVPCDGLRAHWSRLVSEGWSPEEIDRAMLVLLDMADSELLDVTREGERLVLRFAGSQPVNWSAVARSLGVDSWTTCDGQGREVHVVTIPLPWFARRERRHILDFAGCESWDLERVQEAVQDAEASGHEVVNLTSWQRLGLDLLTKQGPRASSVHAAASPSAERSMLWSVAQPVRGGRDGQV